MVSISFSSCAHFPWAVSFIYCFPGFLISGKNSFVDLEMVTILTSVAEPLMNLSVFIEKSSFRVNNLFKKIAILLNSL